MRFWYRVQLLCLVGMVLTVQARQVESGLDVLVAERFARLQGRRVGLVINHTAVDRSGKHIVQLFAQAKGVTVTALYGPEHGLFGRKEAGEHLASATDSLTGAPIFSLYGKTMKPTPEMLQGVDILIFDMQDVGTRFYTYISTLLYTMEAAAEAGIPFMVLDRPNPIGGVLVEGPVLQAEHQSFVGIRPIPLRHGMTIAELARMFNGQGWLKNGVSAKLSVVKMRGWRRDMLFDETGLPWIKPSPNMSNLQAALLYPGIGLLEATNISEGRGTNAPFELIGAPWLQAQEIAELLNGCQADVRCHPEPFIPVNLPDIATYPKYQDKSCQGIRFQILHPRKLQSVRFGLTLLAAVRRVHPDSLLFRDAGMNRLSGDSHVLELLRAGKSAMDILRLTEPAVHAFKKSRRPYLLY
jgi:uncharacterized protein YbbC (DUF1343 family)